MSYNLMASALLIDANNLSDLVLLLALIYRICTADDADRCGRSRLVGDLLLVQIARCQGGSLRNVRGQSEIGLLGTARWQFAHMGDCQRWLHLGRG